MPENILQQGQPFELLSGQKISLIRSIHISGSNTIEALEIETKRGRVIHFAATGTTIDAGPVTAEVLSLDDANGLTRNDLTERLSFAFQSDQLVVRTERLRAKSKEQSDTDAWQIRFSSGDYFVLFRRGGAVDVVCNKLPHGWSLQRGTT